MCEIILRTFLSITDFFTSETHEFSLTRTNVAQTEPFGQPHTTKIGLSNRQKIQKMLTISSSTMFGIVTFKRGSTCIALLMAKTAPSLRAQLRLAMPLLTSQ